MRILLIIIIVSSVYLGIIISDNLIVNIIAFGIICGYVGYCYGLAREREGSMWIKEDETD